MSWYVQGMLHLRELLFVAALIISGCRSDDAEGAEPQTEVEAAEGAATEGAAAEGAATEGAPTAEAESPATERPPENEQVPRRARPASPHARAAAASALDEDERENARLRTERLREGRRLGRAGDHAGSLAAFEQALEVAAGDPALLCEAGFQAFQLGRLDRAAELLTPAVARVMQAPTRGACLYNLGRVREAQGQMSVARRLYAASVEARPNRTVARRLESLVAAASPEQSATGGPGSPEPPESPVSLLMQDLQIDGPARSLEELVHRGRCYARDSLGVPPEPSPELRELFSIDCTTPEERGFAREILVAQSDEGFTAVWPLTMSDTGDMYGRVESLEYLRDPLVWTNGRVTIPVHGAEDEVPGEGDAYFYCEREHGDDRAAMDACFAAETAGQGEPYTWSRNVVFRIVDGALVFERAEGEAYTPDVNEY